MKATDAACPMCGRPLATRPSPSVGVKPAPPIAPSNPRLMQIVHGPTPPDGTAVVLFVCVIVAVFAVTYFVTEFWRLQ